MSGSSRLAPLPGLCLFCGPALADGGPLSLTHTGVGLFALVIFVLAYLLVMAEEYLKLRKSKPVLIAAGIIWIAIGVVYADAGLSPLAHEGFRQNLLEYGELMLFLLVAMTYINAMEDRLLFAALRARLVRAGLSLRTLFWLTGFLAFFISPVVDNLTTALLMCTVVLNVANEDRRFINLACINIVVAANAGGAFSPFGDITTLMVWQAGKVRQFVVSGSGLDNTPSETVCMQADLVAAGIPETAVWQDPAGLRTLDSILRYRQSFPQHSVCIISQPFHNQRALMQAQACGLNAVAYNARIIGVRAGWKVHLRERFARLRMWYDLLRRTRPAHSTAQVPIRQYPTRHGM